MEVEDLRIFTEAAKLKSISYAAANLYLTQSTVSKRIKRLENEVGAKLFNRTHSGVELTQAGQIFYQYASISYGQIIEGISRAQTASNQEIVKIASSASYAASLFAEMIPFLESESIIYEFYHYHSREIIELVRQHVIDIGILETEDTFYPNDIVVKPLFKDPIVLCCSIDHLLSEKETLPFNEIDKQQLALFSWGNDYQILIELLSEHHVPTNQFRKFSPISIVKKLILENHYISFLPLSLIQDEIRNNQLRTISVVGLPPLFYKLSIAYRSSFINKVDIDKLIDGLKQLSEDPSE